MHWIEWLSLAGICALGAISPGPSLLIVLRCAGAGLPQGFACALAHGLAIGMYALLTALGLALALTEWPLLFQGLQWAGALFLAYLGFQALRHAHSRQTEAPSAPRVTVGRAAAQGFGIALFNPKVALFFGALFSQFVTTGQSLLTKTTMAGVAAAVDAGWYLIVTIIVVLSARHGLDGGNWRPWLQRVFGILLIALSARLLWTL